MPEVTGLGWQGRVEARAEPGLQTQARKAGWVCRWGWSKECGWVAPGKLLNISEPPEQDHKDQLTVTWAQSTLPTCMALGHQPNPSKAGKGEKSVCKTRKSGRKSQKEPAGFQSRAEERTRLTTR